jgi:segregation and condensation protein B
MLRVWLSKDGVMDLQEAKRALESILFVADEPVSVARLADALEVERDLVREAARALAAEHSEGGLLVQYEDDSVQMVTAPELAPFVERFLGLHYAGKLSAAALETLAIIAYRQPITTPEIEEIRGVECYGVLKNLLARGLVEVLERLDTAGRPVVYGTTFEFLQYFGLSNLAELPELENGEYPDDS